MTACVFAHLFAIESLIILTLRQRKRCVRLASHGCSTNRIVESWETVLNTDSHIPFGFWFLQVAVLDEWSEYQAHGAYWHCMSQHSITFFTRDESTAYPLNGSNGTAVLADHVSGQRHSVANHYRLIHSFLKPHCREAALHQNALRRVGYVLYSSFTMRVCLLVVRRCVA